MPKHSGKEPKRADRHVVRPSSAPRDRSSPDSGGESVAARADARLGPALHATTVQRRQRQPAETAETIQQVAGNRATRHLLDPAGDRGQARVVARSPNGDGPAQKQAIDRIDAIHRVVKNGIIAFHDEWKNGLQNFDTKMKYPADEKADTAVLEAMGKVIGMAVINSAIGSVPPPWNTVLMTVKDVGVAAFEESEKQLKQARQAKISDFINDTRNAIIDSKKLMISNFDETRRDEILRTFPGDPYARDLGTEAEDWIRRYHDAAQTFKRRIPEQSYFQQQITERFADTGQPVGLVTRGTRRASGTLTLGMRVKVSERGDIDPGSIQRDSRWMLHTSAPEPGNVADSLEESLEGYSPAFSTLPKEVNFDVEVDVPWYTGEALAPCTLHIEGEFGKSNGYMSHDRSTDSELDRRNRRIAQRIGRSGAVATKLLEPKEIDGSSD